MNVMLSKTFFPQHPKAGEPTGFKEKVLKGVKRHTCRCNYDYWKDRIATLQKRQGILSLRQWSGKPYEKGSTQEQILDVAANMIDVQQLVMTRTKYGTAYDFKAEVEGTPVELSELAKNDGLELEDFKAWFNPVFDEHAGNVQLTKGDTVIEPTELSLIFAVIQFSTFRY